MSSGAGGGGGGVGSTTGPQRHVPAPALGKAKAAPKLLSHLFEAKATSPANHPAAAKSQQHDDLDEEVIYSAPQTSFAEFSGGLGRRNFGAIGSGMSPAAQADVHRSHEGLIEV